MSAAPEAVNESVSVVSITTLLPDNSSSVPPTGMGALVTNSTSWLASSFAPALLDVSEPKVTVAVICELLYYLPLHQELLLL